MSWQEYVQNNRNRSASVLLHDLKQQKKKVYKTIPDRRLVKFLAQKNLVRKLKKFIDQHEMEPIAGAAEAALLAIQNKVPIDIGDPEIVYMLDMLIGQKFSVGTAEYVVLTEQEAAEFKALAIEYEDAYPSLTLKQVQAELNPTLAEQAGNSITLGPLQCGSQQGLLVRIDLKDNQVGLTHLALYLSTSLDNQNWSEDSYKTCCEITNPGTYLVRIPALQTMPWNKVKIASEEFKTDFTATMVVY